MANFCNMSMSFMCYLLFGYIRDKNNLTHDQWLCRVSWRKNHKSVKCWNFSEALLTTSKTRRVTLTTLSSGSTTGPPFASWWAGPKLLTYKLLTTVKLKLVSNIMKQLVIQKKYFCSFQLLTINISSQVISSILVTTSQFVGSPIQCMVDGVPTGNEILSFLRLKQIIPTNNFNTAVNRSHL